MYQWESQPQKDCCNSTKTHDLELCRPKPNNNPVMKSWCIRSTISFVLWLAGLINVPSEAAVLSLTWRVHQHVFNQRCCKGLFHQNIMASCAGVVLNGVFSCVNCDTHHLLPQSSWHTESYQRPTAALASTWIWMIHIHGTAVILNTIILLSWEVGINNLSKQM